MGNGGFGGALSSSEFEESATGTRCFSLSRHFSRADRAFFPYAPFGGNSKSIRPLWGEISSGSRLIPTQGIRPLWGEKGQFPENRQKSCAPFGGKCPKGGVLLGYAPFGGKGRELRPIQRIPSPMPVLGHHAPPLGERALSHTPPLGETGTVIRPLWGENRKKRRVYRRRSSAL